MSHLSTLKLHALRYGELEPAEEAEAKAHLETCDRCRGRLTAQENHRAAFELRPVPEAIREAKGEVIRPQFGVRRWLPAVALAAVAVLALQLGGPVEPDTRTKGTAVAEAWLDDGGDGHALAPGEVVHQGDRIQLRFKRPPLPQVTLAGVDGTGAVEIYGRWTAEGEAERWQTAPFSLRLDDTPGDIQVALIFSGDELSDRAVKQAVTGSPPKGVQVRRLLLDKEP
ncbi:MAG: hypothetical protein EP330_02135 [Deltaproteobacteria bacterium]|nr:MAG: hypothetical protein EP330_02135 [Deltaproteobacteria bacterium]